jgi:hypothetical protein
MANKQLDKNSVLNSADMDGDGVVTDAELEKHERMLRMENEDKREDAMRNMAWFALAGMLLYPFAVVIAVATGLEGASKILGDMAATYFVSVAGIVAAFFAAQSVGRSRGG